MKSCVPGSSGERLLSVSGFLPLDNIEAIARLPGGESRFSTPLRVVQHTNCLSRNRRQNDPRNPTSTPRPASGARSLTNEL